MNRAQRVSFHAGAARWLFLLVLGTRALSAYTDPGTGALLWQILLAGAVGSLFYFRRAWGWIRDKLAGSKSRHQAEHDA